jgi:hypothetical protein
MCLAAGRVPCMRVGVYIDGFNLYYGAKAWCGAGTPGWRWLDTREVHRAGQDLPACYMDG